MEWLLLIPVWLGAGWLGGHVIRGRFLGDLPLTKGMDLWEDGAERMARWFMLFGPLQLAARFLFALNHPRVRMKEYRGWF